MNKPGLAARQCATTILTRVIDDGRGLDGLLNTRHGPSSYRDLTSIDQALVKAIVSTCFRHRGEIQFALDQLLDRKLPKNARHLIHTLHGAAAQILFMDVPDSAAVDLAVTALKQDQRSKRFSGLANAVLRRLTREQTTLFASLSLEERAVVNTPPWLRTRIKKAYGRERLIKIAMQHMQEPVIDISVKSNPDHWAMLLDGIPLFGGSVRTNKLDKVSDWPGYDTGDWWVQDAASSLPVSLLGDVNGQTVVDLCAAPGGKTAQLIEKGAIVTALEASHSRLLRLQENLKRLKLDATCIHADLFDWQSDQKFDAVLLDAPCSSTGTIRRHPDVQWTKTPQIVEELAALQSKMILRAAEFLKPGGTLVFANCSIDRTEGEDLYSAILKSRTDLIPHPISGDDVFGLTDIITGQGTVRTLPSHLQDVQPTESLSANDTTQAGRLNGMDGFFAARFTKTG